jgi:hypothetical protein
MFSTSHILSKIDAIEKVRQHFTKDFATIKIKENDGSTELAIDVINFHDVYLPITDTAYLTITESGEFSLYDPFASFIKREDQLKRQRLFDAFIEKIKNVLV